MPALLPGFFLQKTIISACVSCHQSNHWLVLKQDKCNPYMRKKHKWVILKIWLWDMPGERERIWKNRVEYPSMSCKPQLTELSFSCLLINNGRQELGNCYFFERPWKVTQKPNQKEKKKKKPVGERNVKSLPGSSWIRNKKSSIFLPRAHPCFSLCFDSDLSSPHLVW